MTLEISEGGSRTMSGSLDDDLESITRAIEGMFVLKKLTIRARLEASFRIRSTSVVYLVSGWMSVSARL